MDKVFICSPYRGDIKKNLELAKKYCYWADLDWKIPIAPHVYFTTFLSEDFLGRAHGMRYGKELMKICSEVRVYGDEVTEGMLEEISEARKLGIPITIHNAKGEVITYDNYFIHKELGSGMCRIIEDLYADRVGDDKHRESNNRRAAERERDKGSGNAEPEIKVQHTEEVRCGDDTGSKRSGLFGRIFGRK